MWPASLSTSGRGPLNVAQPAISALRDRAGCLIRLLPKSVSTAGP